MNRIRTVCRWTGMAILLLLLSNDPARAAGPVVLLSDSLARHPAVTRAVESALSAVPGVVLVRPEEAAALGSELLLPVDGCGDVDPSCGGQMAEVLGADAVVSAEVKEREDGVTLRLRLSWVTSGHEVVLEERAAGTGEQALGAAATELAGRLGAELRGEER